MCRYTIACEILVCLIALTARAEENVTAVHELVLSHEDQPQLHRSIHQIAQSVAVRIIFFTVPWFVVFEETLPAEELIEANRHSRLSCSNSCWMTVASCDSVIEISHAKNSQNSRMYASTSTAIKNKAAFFAQERRSGSRWRWQSAFHTAVWYSSIRESRSIYYYLLLSQVHNIRCLPNVISDKRIKFSKTLVLHHITGHACFFDINILQGKCI